MVDSRVYVNKALIAYFLEVHMNLGVGFEDGPGLCEELYSLIASVAWWAFGVL